MSTPEEQALAVAYAEQMAKGGEITDPTKADKTHQGGSVSATPPNPTESSHPPSESPSSPQKVIVGGVDLTDFNLPEATIKALESAALRQADYTRKTRALAEQREHLAELERKAAASDQLEAYLQANPEVKSLILDYERNRVSGKAKANGNGLPEDFAEMSPEAQARAVANLTKSLVMEEIKPRFAEIDQKLSKPEMEAKERDELAESYPEVMDLPPDHPIIKACDRLLDRSPDMTLKEAYETVTEAMAGVKEAATQAATKDIQSRKAASGIARPGGGRESEPLVDTRNIKNADQLWDVLANKAMRERGYI